MRSDNRAIRTKRALAEAMLSLLKRYSFDDIAVNDICIRAAVSRTTFYKHFQDKYQLTKFCMQELSHGIMQEVDSHDIGSIIRKSVRMIDANRDIWNNLLLGHSNHEISELLHVMFVEEFWRALQRGAGERVSAESLRIDAVFLAAGVSFVIIWWINDGIALTREEMSDYLISMLERQM